MSGIVSHLKGLAAEKIIIEVYAKSGGRVIASRWQGQCGEIDLILELNQDIVFVEVKSSTSMDRALSAITPHQRKRLATSAEEFLATQPTGSLTACRFDLAAVDQLGRLEIVENALAA